MPLIERVLLVALLLLPALGLTQCQTVGWFSSAVNDTLATLKTLSGNLTVNSVYQLENDIPEQRLALEHIYKETGGPHWSSFYQSTVYLDLLATLEATVPAASESVLPTCLYGFNSVGQLALAGANLTGHLPAATFTGLLDLSILSVAQNPGLAGAITDVPFATTANMLIMQTDGTQLQNPCAIPSLNGRSAAWDIAACFSNLFVPYNLQSSSVANKLGMVCPGLALQRPANLSALTTAFNFNFVQADPLLFSYYNCTCAKPLNPFYYTDAAGLFQMNCTAMPSNSQLVEIVVPLGVFGVVVLCTSCLLLMYRQRLQQEWVSMRVNSLKRRHAPGTLMDRTGKGMEVFRDGITLVMTDVEGSTALWEWNSRVMNSALALHDHTLRSLLPKHYGYEVTFWHALGHTTLSVNVIKVTTEGDAFVVAFHDPIDAIGWALHIQLALLEAPWPPDVLQHPQGRIDVCPEGKLLFRGLRVRMAINTGLPAEIIVHNVTKQVEYRGEMVELTESLTHLPTGGQVVLSGATFQRIQGQLHQVQLPAFTFECPRSSLDTITSRVLSTVPEGVPLSAHSTDPLLQGSSLGSTIRQPFAKRAAWFSFRQSGTGLDISSSPKRSFEGIQHSMPSSAPAGLQHDAGRRHCVSVASDTTALDSLQHSTCTLIHMGSYLLSECRNRPYTAQDAALPPIAGEPVVQILPQALVERAGLFPPMDAARQVSPSFFDAPGAKAAENASAGKARPAGTAGAAPTPSSTSRSAHDPEVAFAFVSEFGYKEAATINKQLASVALGQFKSCVRTSLLLCDGYECQEHDGTFVVAFSSPRAALEWALILQLALLRLPWSDALLSLAPTQDEMSPSNGQLLFRGLSAKVGIMHGPIYRICPHQLTGRADYQSMALDRASRLWAACNAGQIIVEKSLVDAVGLEWRGIQGVALPQEPASHLALRNHALLVHRHESEVATSNLSAKTGSLSGMIGRRLLSNNRRQSSVTQHMQTAARGVCVNACESNRAAQEHSTRPLGREVSQEAGPNMAHLRSRQRRKSLLQHGSATANDVNCAAPLQSVDSEYEEWLRDEEPPATPHPTGRTPGIAKVFSGTWITNTAFRRTGSLSRTQSLQPGGASVEDVQLSPQPSATPLASSTDPKGDSKAEDMPRLPASRQGGVPAAKSLAAPASLKAPVPIPTCPVEVQMHHMGLFSFKGIADKLELCQATPAQLAERMRSYLDVVANSNGKISCIRRVESVALSMTVMLPDILHLPLAAEPPLYINVTPAGAPHQATRGTRQTDLILAHQHKTQD